MPYASFQQALLDAWGRGREGRSSLLLLARVDSTQRLAKRLVEEYERDCATVPAAAVVAWEQTAGRGRGGHSWQGPAGSGAMVTLIRHLERPEDLTLLPMLAAVALAEVIDRHVEGRCRLKWPNDLRVAGKKIGGILIDAANAPGEAPVVLLGFGVNHGGEAEVGLPEATSLARVTASPPSLADLVTALVDNVESWWDRLADGSQLAQRYAASSELRPGDLVRCHVGAELVTGTFRGFDGRGFLRLADAAGERLVANAELL